MLQYSSKHCPKVAEQRREGKKFCTNGFREELCNNIVAAQLSLLLFSKFEERDGEWGQK